MKFEEWKTTVPPEITSDSLWHMQLYQPALFLGELSWFDATKLLQDQRTIWISDQLYRATGKISTNIAEGYSKASGKDQARFYEYALGSSREAHDWYYKARHILNEEVALHRIHLTVHLIRQLLTMIPQHRQKTLREEIASYEIYRLDDLLNTVPMPD
jgi:four helix bundle protein